MGNLGRRKVSAKGLMERHTSVLSSLFGGTVLPSDESLLVCAYGYVGLLSTDRKARKARVEAGAGRYSTGTLPSALPEASGTPVVVCEQGIANLVMTR